MLNDHFVQQLICYLINVVFVGVAAVYNTFHMQPFFHYIKTDAKTNSRLRFQQLMILLWNATIIKLSHDSNDLVIIYYWQ